MAKSSTYIPYLIFSHFLKKDPRISLPTLMLLFWIPLQVTTTVGVCLPSFLSLANLTFLKSLYPHSLVSLIPIFLPNLLWLEPCPPPYSSYGTHSHHQHRQDSRRLALLYVLDTLWVMFHYYPHFGDVETGSWKSEMAHQGHRVRGTGGGLTSADWPQNSWSNPSTAATALQGPPVSSSFQQMSLSRREEKVV